MNLTALKISFRFQNIMAETVRWPDGPPSHAQALTSLGSKEREWICNICEWAARSRGAGLKQCNAGTVTFGTQIRMAGEGRRDAWMANVRNSERRGAEICKCVEIKDNLQGANNAIRCLQQSAFLFSFVSINLQHKSLLNHTTEACMFFLHKMQPKKSSSKKINVYSEQMTEQRHERKPFSLAATLMAWIDQSHRFSKQ